MIYVSSACIKKYNIAEVICCLAEKGIRNIELSGGTKYYSKIENDLLNLKKQYHLKYVCHAYFPPPKIPFVVNLASCNDQIYRQSLEYYEHCIEMLKCIKCSVLSVHAGFLVEIAVDELGGKLDTQIVYEEEKAYERFCSAYKYIAGLCIDNNISLYLENNVLNAENYKRFGNHDYLMMTNYDSIMKMKSQLKFNLLLDLAHLHVSSHALGVNYLEECRKLKDYVGWIHLSENDGIFDEHKPLKNDGAIMDGLQIVYRSGMGITLETVGSLGEICESVKLVERKVSKGRERHD